MDIVKWYLFYGFSVILLISTILIFVKPCDSVNWSYTFSLFCSIWKPRWWKEPLFYIKKKIPFHLILITSFYMHGNLVCTGNNNTLIMCIVGLCKWKCYWVYVCARYNVPSSGHKYCKLKILIATVFFIVFLASNISNLIVVGKDSFVVWISIRNCQYKN